MIRGRVSLIGLEVWVGQMEGYKFFSWFGVGITWFVVFGLISGWEREVGVEDVSGPNDDISFITRLVAATNKACS